MATIKGSKLTEEHKRKIGDALRGRKYKPMSEEGKENIREANVRRVERGWKPTSYQLQKAGEAVTGAKNHLWRGDKVGYRALHEWVERHLGLPTRCEQCGKDGLRSRNIHWANKSGKYLRELTDWLRLCVPCHKAYDLK